MSRLHPPPSLLSNLRRSLVSWLVVCSLIVCVPLVSWSPLVAGQDIVDDGVLPNGVAINTTIVQGESQYWAFLVSPSDVSTGSSLTDVSFTILSASGQLALNVITPSGVQLQPPPLGGGVGLLLTNRTTTYNDAVITQPDGTNTTVDGDGGAGANPTQWPQLEYGVYLLQVFSGQQDTYTISASLYRRTQLSTNIATPVGLVNNTVGPAVNTYAEYIWTTPGPVVMTVTMLVDVAFALSQGQSPSSLQLPSLWWARNADDTAWSPATYAMGSLQPIVGQVDALLTIEDDCIGPPCQYSFLLVNPSTALPSAPLLTVNANWTQDTQLDYEYDNADNSTNGELIYVTTTPITLPQGQVVYHVFEVLDAQASIVLTVSGCGAGTPVGEFVVLVSNQDGLPDQTPSGSQYSLSTVKMSTSVAQPSSVSLTLLPSDVTFSPSGPAVGQLVTMEGLYYVTVLAHTSGCYQLTLNVTDQANETASALVLNQPLVGVLNPQQLIYLRFTTPRDFDAFATDIVLSTVNASLYLSDITSTPGPQSQVLLLGSVYNSALGAVYSLDIASGTSSLHAGTYYVGVYNRYYVPVPFSLVVSFSLHTTLLANSTWVSDQPLAYNAVRYFEYVQPGLSAETVQITVNCSDPTASAALYVIFVQRPFPYSTNLNYYPTPSQSYTYTTSASGMNNGVLQMSMSYTCVAQYSCVWQMTLAPVNTTQGLSSYSVSVQVVSGLAAAVLQLNSTVTGVLTSTSSFDQASAAYQFQATSYSAYRITVTSQGSNSTIAPTLQLSVDSDHVLVTDPYNQAQYMSSTAAVPFTNNTLSSTTILMQPSDAPFGVRSLPNIGATYIGTWYVIARCYNYCGLDTNYTLTVTPLPYTGDVSVLIPQVINSTSAVTFSLNIRQYAFYSFVCPSVLPSNTDITVAVGPSSLTYGNAYGGPDIFISPVNPLPTIQNFNFTNVIFNSGASQSITLSNDDNTLPSPGQVLYISVYAAQLQPLTSTLKITVSQRIQMTGNGIVQLPSPITPGTTQQVELTLVGQSNPSLYVQNTFMFSVVSPNTSSLLPTCNVASLLTNTDTWQSSFGILFQNVLFNPSAVNWWRSGDRCSRYAGTCVYKFLLYFPSALPSASFAISGLNQTQSALSTIATQPLAPLTTITDQLAAGEVRFYAISVPLQAIFTTLINITVQPLTSTADPNLIVTAGTGLVPIAYGYSGQSQSARAAGFTDSVVTRLQSPYAQVIYVQLQGVQAGPFTLSVNVTSYTVVQNLTGVITLDRSVPDQQLLASFNSSYRGPPIWQLTVPADFDSSSDLYLTANPTSSVYADLTMWVWKGVYPYPVAQILQYFPRASYVASTYNGYTVSQLLRNTQLYNNQTIPPTPLGIMIQPGDVLYIVVSIPTFSAGTTFSLQLSVSYSQRTALTLGSTVTGALSIPFSGREFTINVPAVQVLGQWLTSVRFFASLTTAGPTIATVSQQGPMVLYATTSLNPRGAVPYAGQIVGSQFQGSDLSSVSNRPWQFLDVQDTCRQSTCSYTVLVMDNQVNVSTVSYTLTTSQPSTSTQLVPGLATSPTSISTGSMQFYTVLMPHSQMTVQVALQTLTSGANSTGNGNADLYVGWSSAYQYPTPTRYMSGSASDDSTAFDSLTISYLTAGLRQGSPLYIGVFGERAATYTLLVTLSDYGPPNPFITNNQLVTASVPAESVSYYQYPLGTVTSSTDLSILLLPQSGGGSGRLFGTFSYSHPGPVNGSLPASLPYEMLTNVSSGVAQLTLTQKLSSSNLLPLRSQSTLYVAVASVTSALLQYSLSVSLSQRVALDGASSTLSSATFARVSAGSVQYFAISFSLPLQPSALQAVLILTALQSPLSALPTVYVTNSILSPLVDPVFSSPATYTSSAGPGVGAFNAVAIPMTSLCPSSVTVSCVWKVLVAALVDLPSYTLAVTTFVDGDQQPLQLSTPVVSSVADGRLVFFTFTAPVAAISLTLSLRSLDSEGNADLFVSTTATHPTPASYQWASFSDTTSSTDTIVLLPSDPLYKAGGVYYVAVFGQRVTAYQLTLTAVVPVSSNSSSSSGSSLFRGSSSSSSSTPSPPSPLSPTSTPSTASTTSSSINPTSASSSSAAPDVGRGGDNSSSGVSLAVFLPILIVLCVLVVVLSVVLLYCLTRRGALKTLLSPRGPHRSAQSTGGGGEEAGSESDNTTVELSSARFAQIGHNGTSGDD